jgi:hypothetical protein
VRVDEKEMERHTGINSHARGLLRIFLDFFKLVNLQDVIMTVSAFSPKFAEVGQVKLCTGRRDLY